MIHRLFAFFLLIGVPVTCVCADVPKHMIPGECTVSGEEIHSKLGIHAMIFENQALDVAENRQLTTIYDGKVEKAAISPDGKYVAYIINNCVEARLCVVSASGGPAKTIMAKSEAIMKRLKDEVKGGNENAEAWMLDIPSSLVWSPDSKMIAFMAQRYKVGNGGSCIVFATREGEFYKTIAIPRGHTFIEDLHWSPDGQWIGARSASHSPDAAPGRLDLENVVLFNAASGDMRVVVTTDDKHFLAVDGWNEKNGSLRYTASAYGSSGGEIYEVQPLGQTPQAIAEKCEPGWVSPDGSLRVVSQESGISVKNLSTGKEAQLSKMPTYCFLGWAPNSRTLLYRSGNTIKDETGERERYLHTLWLISTEQHKGNSMCVALDYMDSGTVDGSDWPTWSSDSMKIAYKAQGRLYVAELFKRPATSWELLSSGMPLPEEDLKRVMKLNAEMIAMALREHAEAHESKFQESDAAIREFMPESSHKAFYVPSTERKAFTYYPGQTLTEDDSQTTLVGTLDAGYGWTVQIMSDLSVKVSE